MRRYSYKVEPRPAYLMRSECTELAHAGDEEGKEKLRKLAVILSDLELRVYDCITSSEIKPTSLLDAHIMKDATFDSPDSCDCDDDHSDFFRQNYEKIMRGEIKDWILCGIGLWYDRIKLQYCDCSIGDPVERKKREGTIYFWNSGTSVRSIHSIARVPQNDSSAFEKYEFWWYSAGWKFENGKPGNNFDIHETSPTGERCTLEYLFDEYAREYFCTIYQGVHIPMD